jgi:hypothetical protein
MTENEAPVVHVTAMRLGLTPDQPTRDWYAWCGPCNWYGDEREDLCDAQADAARHRCAHVIPPAVVEEWAVDLGFAISRVSSEAKARAWVQSYADHPEALDGDPTPVAVRRTVTTTPWTRVIPPAEECIAPPGNLCTETGCWDADRCVVASVIPPEDMTVARALADLHRHFCARDAHDDACRVLGEATRVIPPEVT